MNDPRLHMRKTTGFIATLSLLTLAPALAMACGNAMLVHNYTPSTVVWVASMPVAVILVKLIDRIKPGSVQLQLALLFGCATIPNLIYWFFALETNVILLGFNAIAAIGLIGYAALFVHIMRERLVEPSDEYVIHAPFKTKLKIFAGTILAVCCIGFALEALEPDEPETTYEGGFHEAESISTEVTF